MSRESIMLDTRSDVRIDKFIDKYIRRISATPNGMCPVGFTLSMLKASHAQTCGKCVPCRDGLGQLEELLEEVLEGIADYETLAEIRTLAASIRDTADCAIGYDAAAAVLESLDTFGDIYESYVDFGVNVDGAEQTIPCRTSCPAHVRIPEYIALVGEGRYADAIKVIREDNPFPTACALICEHPCEERCRRQIIDSPINIRGIKKKAVEEIAADKVPVPERLPDTGKNVAVIGGGPSGLTCAYFLALMGHKVTVFEEENKLGGMLRYGIPAYRFPRERLDEDINAILSAGNIDVKLKHRVGDTGELINIRNDFDAMYVAIGSHTEKKLRIDNIDAKGIHSAVSLLREIGNDNYPDFTGKRVVVVGGGNVAMDCARTARRSNAESVSIVYRRRREDMTALDSEVESAVAEGIELITLKAPVAVTVDSDNNCTGLKVQKQMIGPADAVGRPRPMDANCDPEVMECDIILVAIGQDIDSKPFEDFGMVANRNIFAAEENLSTAVDGVFVGGDCQTGPKTVIRAIEAGKVAAYNIDEYLGFNHVLKSEIEIPEAKANNITPTGRVNIEEREARERANDFEGVELSISDEEAKQECSRCLRCDHFGCGAM